MKTWRRTFQETKICTSFATTIRINKSISYQQCIYYARFTTKVVQLLRVHIISSISLPLRPTTFCTTLLSYLKCKIIGISEYDRNCCTVCTTISTICTLIVTLGWGFRALPWYAHTSKVRILLILVQLFC